MEFIHEYMALIMFAAVFALLLLGYPVAFTIGGVSLFFGLWGFGPSFFELMPLRVWGTMSNFTLMAVPLFIYMGYVLSESGIAEDLYKMLHVWFGRIGGGLAIGTIFLMVIIWLRISWSATKPFPSR